MVQSLNPSVQIRAGFHIPLEVADYVSTLMNSFIIRSTPATESLKGEDVAKLVYETLTNRKYSYLSKKRASCYSKSILSHSQECADSGAPISFYYDIGAGYHASFDPSNGRLTYRPGFAELLILRQIACFDRDVRNFYRLGTHFHLVIDNLCAYSVNGILLANTERYCEQIRQLIKETGQSDKVDLLVESEITNSDEYLEKVARKPHVPVPPPSEADVENVSRFVGRTCSQKETAKLMELYKRTTLVSDEILNQKVDGIRMTQRATPSTFGFRPFPGGDSRIQAGEVALRKINGDKIQPFLLTSRNICSYDCFDLKFDSVLPNTVKHVIYAKTRT